MGVFRDAIRQLVKDREAARQANLAERQQRQGSGDVRSSNQFYSDTDKSFDLMNKRGGYGPTSYAQQNKYAPKFYEQGTRIAADEDPRGDRPQWGAKWLAKDEARSLKELENQEGIDALTKAWNNQPDEFKEQNPLDYFIQQYQGVTPAEISEAGKEAGEKFDEEHPPTKEEAPGRMSWDPETGEFYYAETGDNKDKDTSGGANPAGGSVSSGDSDSSKDNSIWDDQSIDVDPNSWYGNWEAWMKSTTADTGQSMWDKYHGSLTKFETLGTYNEWQDLLYDLDAGGDTLDDVFGKYYSDELEEYGGFQGWWDHYKSLAIEEALRGNWGLAKEIWGDDWNTLVNVVNEMHRMDIAFYPEYGEDALQQLGKMYDGETYEDTQAYVDALTSDRAAAANALAAEWMRGRMADDPIYGDTVTAKDLRTMQRNINDRY